MAELETERLILRRWRPDDRAPFAALNADPEVMRYFPARLSRAESDAFVDGCDALLAERGWGWWALELRASGEFIGFAGISAPGFMPAVETGWRLARPAWGHGYASEAARAAVDYGFQAVGLDEVVSFTTLANARSRAVMERLGMTHDPADDFDHPALPPDSPLRRHVLYRLRAT